MIKKIKSIFTQFLNSPVFVFKLFFSFFRKKYICKTNFLSLQEFYDEIKKGRSVIRMGDGEIGLMYGKSIFHQNSSKNLEKIFRRIIKEYKENSDYILCLPKFLNISNSELKKKNILICWLPFKVEFRLSFNKNAHYGDAHIFYYKEETKFIFDNFIKNQKVLYVCNNKIIHKIKQTDLHNKNSFFVETPELGTLEILDNLESKINDFLSKNKETKIIFSCGSASKVLAYKYSLLGFQSFDIGTGINCYIDDKDYSHLI